MKQQSVIIGVCVAILLGLLLEPFPHIEVGNVGLTWNPLKGEVSVLSPGWHVVGPATFVTEIDVRPQRLCLSSSSHAGVNCRLVQFDVSHYKDFIAVEGWHRYWWSNRISFNSGYPETYRGFRDVLRGYAFSAQPYSFVKILEE